VTASGVSRRYDVQYWCDAVPPLGWVACVRFWSNRRPLRWGPSIRFGYGLLSIPRYPPALTFSRDLGVPMIT
jgi:hypothetical protein